MSETQYTPLDLNKGNVESRAKLLKPHLPKAGKLKKVCTDEFGALAGYSLDLARELPQIVKRVNALRSGSKVDPAVDISLGEYVHEVYGIEKDAKGSSANFMKLLGLDTSRITLHDLTRDGRLKFTSVSGLDGGFEWLIGETITEAIRAGLYQRGTYRSLIASSETVPFDRITIPQVQNAQKGMQTKREGATIEADVIKYGEQSLTAKTVASRIFLTDEVIRNVQLNILQDWLFSNTGMDLDRKLTNDAIFRLVNGNQPGTDGAPVVGVVTPSSFDYDDDWLEVVIAMAENGYSATQVLGNRAMIKEAMALPEFKGFDGTAVKAQTGLGPNVPLPSMYNFIPFGGVAANTLIFLDQRQALRHYMTKPLTLENSRDIVRLGTDQVISMTTVFARWYQDAVTILNKTLDVATNPYPSAFDAETYDANRTFDM